LNDRYTERARLAVALAKQFAREQRRPIEPEHILRGIASGGRGVGRAVLEELGIDLFRLLPEIAELLAAYPAKPLPPIGEMLASDPSKYFPEPVLGAGAVACLDTARRIAKELRHNYLGTEHLVMGLVDGQSSASAFLRARGATGQSVRDGVVRLLIGDGS
jgi:ATP-dependent Clp protease ATP-binding subunit ClpC